MKDLTSLKVWLREKKEHEVTFDINFKGYFGQANPCL